MRTKWLAMAMAAALAALTAGCAAVLVGGAAAAAGVGTYAYVSGALTGSEAVSLDRAWSASQAAMKDLEFPITNKAKAVSQVYPEVERLHRAGIVLDVEIHFADRR